MPSLNVKLQGCTYLATMYSLTSVPVSLPLDPENQVLPGPQSKAGRRQGKRLKLGTGFRELRLAQIPF